MQKTKSNLETPILLITFNRPNTTQKVFDKIRQVQPSKLFVFADGPRHNDKSDKINCIEVRKVIDQIDWKCEIQTLFHETNLGCGLAPSTAITWFFDHVNEGIILEDDCVPNLSFFYFCQKLLKFYTDDSRVFHISGTKYPHHFINNNKNSYYFTRIPEVMGWATWKRAWNKYDFTMKTFPLFEKEQVIKNIFDEEIFQQVLSSHFQNRFVDLQKSTKPDAWDLQWFYTILIQNGLCITPNKNLISNIGFGENSTHTKIIEPFLSDLPTQEMDIGNIKHPNFMLADKKIERWIMENIFKIKVPIKLIWKTKKIIKTKFPTLTKFYTNTKRRLFNEKNK